MKPAASTRPALHRAATAGQERREGRGSEAKNDRLASRKQLAVTGDMYPTGVSPSVPRAAKPRSSAAGRMPTNDKTSTSAAINAPAEVTAAAMPRAPRPSAGRARKISAPP